MDALAGVATVGCAPEIVVAGSAIASAAVRPALLTFAVCGARALTVVALAAVIAAGVTVRHRCVGAPGVRNTLVSGACIPVIAVIALSPHANAVGTLVHGGAWVPIVARCSIQAVLASDFGNTTVICAEIAVVAVLRAEVSAASVAAMVASGARVFVITRTGYCNVVALPIRNAKVLCARVVVITILEFSCCAGPTFAMVSGRAGIAVITSFRVVGMDTAFPRLADIVRARVPVITILQPVERAEAACAVISQRTLVFVVAVRGVGGVSTALAGFTGIVRAGIAVVAVLLCPGSANLIEAAIPDRAEIAIIAGDDVAFVNATFIGLARVVSAYIPVIAVHLHTRRAYTIAALVPQGAQIPILAGEALVVRYERAITRFRGAQCFQAECTRTLWGRAVDNGYRVDLAGVRQLGCVAVECAIADVPILQLSAVLIHQAVARELDADTFTALALVPECARVLIVAGFIVVVVFAAPGFRAVVVCAGIAIVAVDQFAYAHALLAVVGLRARIVIHALAAFLR